jgi:hypothetical protein
MDLEKLIELSSESELDELELLAASCRTNIRRAIEMCEEKEPVKVSM